MTMKMLSLRGYQGEALSALENDWATGLTRLAVVLPTGMGKTVVFAHLIEQTARAGHRVLVMVHREELAQQARDKIHSVAPDLQVGIVKAERNETDGDVIVASVQTLARRSRREQIPADSIGLVIVDECHHAAARTWVEVLTYFGCFAGTRAAGFTATMSREDGRGLGDIWQKVSYTKDILYGIQNGFLTDVRGKSVTVDGLDLGTVARSRGDYQDGALGDAMEASGAGGVIASAYREHAGDRQGVLFAPTVSSAHAFAADLVRAGITTDVITGSTPPEDRVLAYKRYAAGDTQVLSNCMVLTEGWDAPWASCAVIARPTQSAGLYIQMVGRVLRPWLAGGKKDALVLDVVGITGRHALRSIVDLTTSALTLQDGESLAEGVERDTKEKGARPAASALTGTIGHEEVDLFHRSKSVWLQTYGGIWFIPTTDWTYFLWPEQNGITWKVGRKPTWRNRTAKGGWLQEELTLEYAMAWGEQDAAEVDPSISRKTASWRRQSNKPSQGQLDLLARYGLPITEGMSKSEASDLISIHLASRDLDRGKR
jgi:superfamily II DNA or RNA helicase